nr:uncharacterized protein LOC129282947 [Lytechinus pictus]
MTADEMLKGKEEMKNDEEKMMAGEDALVITSLNNLTKEKEEVDDEQKLPEMLEESTEFAESFWNEMWMERVKLEEEDKQKKEIEPEVPELQDFKEEIKMSGKDGNIKKESIGDITDQRIVNGRRLKWWKRLCCFGWRRRRRHY